MVKESVLFNLFIEDKKTYEFEPVVDFVKDIRHHDIPGRDTLPELYWHEQTRLRDKSYSILKFCSESIKYIKKVNSPCSPTNLNTTFFRECCKWEK